MVGLRLIIHFLIFHTLLVFLIFMIFDVVILTLCVVLNIFFLNL